MPTSKARKGSSSGPKPEDKTLLTEIVEECSNKEAVEQIVKALKLEELITQAVSKALREAQDSSSNKEIEKARQETEEALKEVKYWKEENERKAKVIEAKQVELKKMKELLMEGNTRMDQLEQYTRREDLIIRGLTDVHEEQVEVQVMESISNQLHIAIQPSDISICHKLPKGKFDKTPPVIVRFSNRKKRNEVYKARKNLRKSSDTQKSSLIIHEHLTKRNAAILKEARNAVAENKILFAWTNDCKVLVRLKPTDRNLSGLVVHLKSVEDLVKLIK